MPPPKDALRIVLVHGQPTFPDAPRRLDGSVDQARMGNVGQSVARGRSGRRHSIDPTSTSPHPTTGAPVRPE